MGKFKLGRWKLGNQQKSAAIMWFKVGVDPPLDFRRQTVNFGRNVDNSGRFGPVRTRENVILIKGKRT
jgi:hypothetical protein